MATGMEFCLLGPLTVRCDGVMVAVPAGKQRTVLAALLLNVGHVLSLDDLAEVLWGREPPPSARVSVQNYVMRLRKALSVTGQNPIRTQMGGYSISADTGELDVTRFEALLGAAQAGARDRSWDAAARQAHAALALWRDEPLADVESEMLVQREVPRLAEMRLQALETRLGADLHLGHHPEVAAELRRLVAAHPLREQLHAMLMLALYRDSRQGEALAAYQHARQLLVDDLGVEPGPQLRSLHEQILAGDPTLITTPATAIAGRRGKAATVAGDEAVVVPRQLPAAVPHFAGREAELAALFGPLAERAASAGTVVISAIGGMAGVGKTALAVHWAHQVADQFPDGQLYINLRSFGPSDDPVAPAVAVRGFLEALGVAAERIPASPEAQTGLYRSLLAGRRVLLVLDNARDEDQVRPLLPANPGCLVVVTSRTQLTGLVAADGARIVNLDVLTEAGAREVISRRLGTERAPAEPDAVSELFSLCGRLPLALAITAARAATCPGFPLAALVAELREGQHLDGLAAGDAATSVRAVFSWSYRHLAAPAARLFRLLGLHPGHDITKPAAACLADLPASQARDLLRELARANLLTEPAPGRYAFHDLVRAYAAGQAEVTDGEQEGKAALTRLFDYYLATAGASMDTLAPAEQGCRPKVGKPRAGSPSVATPETARAWLDVERANLVAIAGRGATCGWPGHVTSLAAILFRYLDDGAHYPDALSIHTHALVAARKAGDRAAQADALRSRSAVDYRQGRYPSTARQLRQALSIYRELGDRRGRGRTLSNLSLVLLRQGSYQEAVGYQRQSLVLARQVGDQFGQALALDGLGMVLCRQGRCHEAADCHQRAMALYRELGDPRREAGVLDNLGVALSRQGRWEEAVSFHEQALAAFRELDYLGGEADALSRLGVALCGQGRYLIAADHQRQAHTLFRDLGNRLGEANALNGIGEALTALGQFRQARAQHRDALTLAGDIRDPYLEARAHDGLARAHQAAGETGLARHHWEQALERYRALGVPEAGEVHAVPLTARTL